MVKVISDGKKMGFGLNELFEKALTKKNPTEFILKNLDQKSKYHHFNMHQIAQYAANELIFISEIFINRINPDYSIQDGPYNFKDFTLNELTTRYYNCIELYHFSNNFTNEIFNQNYLKSKIQQDNQNLNIEDDYEIKDVFFIKNKKLHWFGQPIQLAFVIYLLKDEKMFASYNPDSVIDKLMSYDIINLLTGDWSSIRKELKEDIPPKMLRTKEKRKYPFKKKFDVELSFNKILEMISTREIQT